MKATKLDGMWELGFSREGRAFQWIKAKVPGDVHLDLMRAGLLEEPLYGMNAEKCLWTAEVTWHYRKKFHLEKLEKDVRYELTFCGLDTTCTIFLNEQEIGRHNNMFVPCSIDVTKNLVAGENTLLVKIDSGINQYKDKYPDVIKLLKHRSQQNVDAIVKIRIWIRKTLIGFGWDCAPVLMTCGIWRSVGLRRHKILALRNPYITSKLDKDSAIIDISFELEKFIEKNIQVEIRTRISNRGKTIGEVSKFLTVGKNPIKESMHLKNPSLWWPIPFGRPNLYDISIEVNKDGVLLDSYNDRFGIREIKLEQRNLGHGEKTFTFVVNGKRIFAKGANWFPADSILARVNEQKYRELIRLAREANFNMLRVWGGGIYEDELFYKFCDENGIMVWQDFMFACALYPDGDKEFLENITRECEIAVKQLRNHPSIVLWCGNNEGSTSKRIVELFGKYRGWKIFHRLLPNICKRLDPQRIYWPASPYGDGDEYEGSNTAREGDRHSWFGVPDYRKYADEKGKFISEFYAFAPSAKESLEKFLPPEELRVDSKSWKFHTNPWPWERLFRRFAEKNFISGRNPSFDDYLLGYQLYQGEAYRYALECFRRRKFICSGSLFWVYNDCWGATGSWTIVDYYLNRPLAYYYVKKAYAPLLLSFQEEKDKVSVWIVNDYLKNFSAELTVRQIDFTEGEKHRWEEKLVIGENSSEEVMRIQLGKISDNDRATQYLCGELKSRGEVIADNTYFFEMPRKLLLPKARVLKSCRVINNSIGILTLRSDVFAYAVRVSELGNGLSLDENYFNINPGEEKKVVVRGKNITLADLKKFKISTFNM